MNEKFNTVLEEDVFSWKTHIYSEMLELHFQQNFFIIVLASKLF